MNIPFPPERLSDVTLAEGRSTAIQCAIWGCPNKSTTMAITQHLMDTRPRDLANRFQKKLPLEWEDPEPPGLHRLRHAIAAYTVAILGALGNVESWDKTTVGLMLLAAATQDIATMSTPRLTKLIENITELTVEGLPEAFNE